MQVIRTVIGRELVLFAVQRESALRNAVPVAADNGSEVRIVAEIPVEGVEAEDNVGESCRYDQVFSATRESRRSW